jgi:rhomboid protease GluP
MLPPRLRWKLRIVAQQLEKQLDYWNNLWRGTRVTTRMCPSCRALVGVRESVCSLCGTRLRRRPSGLGKLLTNVLPRYTPVSYGLLTTNFLVFLAMFATEQQGAVSDFGRLLTGGNQQALVAWGADVAVLVAQGEWWRLVSAIFIHIGIIHLLFNSYALLFIGPLLEELLGKERFLVFYLATGVFGFFLSNWYYPPFLVTAGASGAVFGMIAMAAVLSRRWGSWGQMLQQQLVHWIIYAFVFGIFIGANNAAHFGGALAGAALAFALPNPNRRQETSFQDLLWRVLYWAGLAIIALSLSLAVLNRLEL